MYDEQAHTYSYLLVEGLGFNLLTLVLFPPPLSLLLFLLLARFLVLPFLPVGAHKPGDISRWVALNHIASKSGVRLG